MKNVKKMLVFIITIVLIVTITSCRNEDNNNEIVISIAWWGSQTRHDRTVEVLRMFETENPGIRFEEEFFDWDGYIIALNTRVAAGNVWDIFQLGGNYHEYIDNIFPLNDFINQGIIDTSMTPQDFIDITTLNGDVIGLSNGIIAWGIVYDPILFDQAGVNRPHSQWTWEEFESSALRIHETLGIWGISNFPHPNDIALKQYMWQQGVNFYHPTDVKQLGFNDPAIIVPFLEMRKNLVTSGAAPDPGDTMLFSDIESDPLVTSTAAMTYVGSNQFPILANAALTLNPNRQLNMTLIPGHPGGDIATDVVTQKLSISSDSKNPEVAAQFLNFFANSVEANLILRGERGVPIMSHVRERLELESDPMVAETYSFINQIIESGGDINARLGNPRQGEIADFINLTVERVVLDMVTPTQGAQDIYDFALNVVQKN
jgi:multiple sugar transport system substrate-binding protein